MDYWMLNIAQSALFIGMFFIAIFLCVPKSVKYWHVWKKTGVMIHLSHAIAVGTIAFFLLAATLFVLLQAALGYSAH